MGADKIAAPSPASAPALPSASAELEESTAATGSASAARPAALAGSGAALASATPPASLSASAPPSAPSAEAPLDETLCGLLLEGLGALADAGGVEKACRLAGRAYVALRHESPQQARRFDVLLHRLSRRLDW